MVRINHGLRPKYRHELPSSGFALLMEKVGVMEDNVRRAKLFKEREIQLFQIIKKLWNEHHNKAGEKKFSDKCRLEIMYKEPSFPIDPKTKLETILMEDKVLDSGDREVYKKIYPHLTEAEINKRIKQRRKDKLEQDIEDANRKVAVAKIFQSAGILEDTESKALTGGKVVKASESSKLSMGQKDDKSEDLPKSKIDNRVKHSEKSSIQKKKNGDFRSDE